jgi:hypothetical protein
MRIIYLAALLIAPRAETVTLPRDTPVELMAPTEVTTATAKAGDRFKLRINRAIPLDDGRTIPVGTPAFGEVIEAEKAGSLGRRGTLIARVLHIQYGDVTIPLKGEIGTTGTIAGSLNMAVTLAGPIGLFHRGNNAKIKAGDIFTAYVAEDVVLTLPAAP